MIRKAVGPVVMKGYVTEVIRKAVGQVVMRGYVNEVIRKEVGPVVMRCWTDNHMGISYVSPLGSFFSSEVAVYGHCLVILRPTNSEVLKRLYTASHL